MGGTVFQAKRWRLGVRLSSGSPAYSLRTDFPCALCKDRNKRVEYEQYEPQVCLPACLSVWIQKCQWYCHLLSFLWASLAHCTLSLWLRQYLPWYPASSEWGPDSHTSDLEIIEERAPFFQRFSWKAPNLSPYSDIDYISILYGRRGHQLSL